MVQPTLNEFLDQQEQVTQDRFTVDSDDKANWVLRKIKQLNEKRQENIALAEAEIEKIEAWLEQVNNQLQGDIDYFQGMLVEYAVKRREEDPKFKSLKLPNGRIGFRKQQPKWHYDDEKLLETLKNNGYDDYIKVKEQPDKSSIKKVFKPNGEYAINPETGEILEGVRIEQRDDAFKLEVND